jgi:hypothetical protein
MEHMIGGNAQNITLAGLAQRHFNIADTVDTVRRDEAERRTGQNPHLQAHAPPSGACDCPSTFSADKAPGR